MRLKRILCMVLSCMFFFGTLSLPANAAENAAPGSFHLSSANSRANGSFDMTVPANAKLTADSSFLMEEGETVTIKASYFPFSASVDFGLIAPDGNFYYITITDGSIDETIQISESGSYTFQVRNNSTEIDPETHFGSVTSQDLRSFGSSICYNLSTDRKTLWIEEERSSSSKYNSYELHTVTLENLEFGENGTQEPIKGTWDISFQIQINNAYTELLREDVSVPISGNDGFSCQLSSIQLSSFGIHMEMTLPDNDINRLKDFKAVLVLKNGSVLNLELHHSIRGKKEPFHATAETMFTEAINLDNVSSVVICGREIYC